VVNQRGSHSARHETWRQRYRDPPETLPRPGHELRYPNVIVAHWPRPGTGQLVRAWHCLTCKPTIYDD
jgi:hypothetical protein